MLAPTKQYRIICLKETDGSGVTPPSGFQFLYPKSLGGWFIKDDTGEEKQLSTISASESTGIPTWNSDIDIIEKDEKYFDDDGFIYNSLLVSGDETGAGAKKDRKSTRLNSSH